MSEQKTGARRASHHRHDARARRYVRRDAIRRNALSAVRPSPARAASPDAKVWLPLDGLAALPALDELLERNVAPNARAHTVLRSAHDGSTAPAGRALPKVHPSPARARPHDPDSWFPLAALEELLAPDRLVDSGQTRAVAPEHEPVLRAPAVDSPDVVDVVDLEQLWELQPVADPEPVSDLRPVADPEPVSDLRPDPDPELAPRPLIVPEPRSAPKAVPSPAPLRAVPQPTRRDRIAIRRARARRRLLVVTIATTVVGVCALAAPLLGATATETDATTHRGTASTTSTRGGSLRWLLTAAAAAPAAPAPAAPAAPAPAAPSTPPPPAAPVPATPVVRAPAPLPKKPVPAPRPTVVMPHTGNTRSGTATWYSHAAGTCAHLGLRMGTSVRITNTANGATASCTVADRGPEAWTGNIIDLSPDVFRQLAPLGAGRINVRLDY
jgi:Lytic transglycolase